MATRFLQTPNCMACLMVIPAYAEMACLNHWIPAFAGMTAEVDSSLCWNDGKSEFRLSPKPARLPLSSFPVPSQYTLQD